MQHETNAKVSKIIDILDNIKNVEALMSGDNIIITMESAVCPNNPFTITLYSENAKSIMDSIKIAKEINNYDFITNLIYTDLGIVRAVKRTKIMNNMKDENTFNYDSEGNLYFKDRSLNEDATALIEDYLNNTEEGKEGIIPDRIIAFFNRLYENPSYRVFNELLKFIESKNMPIFEDGTFLSYKAVDGAMKDIYTHTIENKIGAEITMDRREIDDDHSVGCSRGLHAGSLDYAINYGSINSSYSNNVLINVRIDPADVVTVPTEDVRKLRCCRYIVHSRVLQDGLDAFDFILNENEIDGDLLEKHEVNENIDPTDIEMF